MQERALRCLLRRVRRRRMARVTTGLLIGCILWRCTHAGNHACAAMPNVTRFLPVVKLRLDRPSKLDPSPFTAARGARAMVGPIERIGSQLNRQLSPAVQRSDRCRSQVLHAFSANSLLLFEAPCLLYSRKPEKVDCAACIARELSIKKAARIAIVRQHVGSKQLDYIRTPSLAGVVACGC